ncbi:MAG: phosphatase PAP2 family protein [Candidatus Thorarchaeota archaeon]|jgi:membrane-associated phospholipid phosphatase
MFFDPNITTFLRDLLPWAGPFFSLVTEVGGDLVYISLLLIGYWTFRKRESILLALVLMVSFIVNYWLKYVIANPRPPSAYWYDGAEAFHYSTPSGHAQNPGTVYTWLAAKVKTWWMVLVSVVVVLLIGISRVYLGVHFLGDVLIGWGIGITLALLSVYYEEPIGRFLSRFKEDYWFLMLFTLGFALTLLSSVLPYPPDDNFGAYGGLIMGIAISISLERRFVDFTVETTNSKKIGRIVVGLILVLVLMVGLSLILPSEEIWLRALRYFTVVFVGAFVWPFIFNRAGL